MMRTYQTRLGKAPEDRDPILSSYAALYGKVERTLFSRLSADNDKINSLKQDFLPRFGITARQFKAVRIGLGGKVSSIKERRPGLIEELKKKIEKAKRVIVKITKTSADSDKLHQKKRRLAILEQRLAHLQEDHKNDTVRLCFGSRKLFCAQVALEDNGYADHAEWYKDWQASRNNQFFVIGSKDETAGCQGCVATVAEDGSISLRLRLPNSRWGTTNCSGQKYAVITGLRFAYGHKEIVAAIGRNLSNNKQDWQAISYRFLRDSNGWRVFVSVALPEVKKVSDRRLGVIGVDINEDFLAVTETDRYGNPIATWTIPCCTYGKSKEQSRAVIGDAVKELMAIVIAKKKPLAIEELDFRKKKALLENSSPKYARMLSSFAYTQIQTLIRSRAFDAGIEVLEVNPAYTSVIGAVNFARRYGISIHQGAALAIARRSLGFSERPSVQVASVPCDGGHVTFPLPATRNGGPLSVLTHLPSARNRDRASSSGKHVWQFWSAVYTKSKAALAAHRRSAAHCRSSRSGPVPDAGVILPPVIPLKGHSSEIGCGAIPVCESSVVLFD